MTDKRSREQLRSEVLGRLCGEIAAARRSPDVLPIVLGHGSGSFGHVAAQQHGMTSWEAIDRGRGRPLLDAESTVEVLRAARQLHQHVLRELQAVGVPAVSMPPNAWLSRSAEGRLVAATQPLLAALQHDLVPVVFGDVILGPDGAAVCSTETVLAEVAASLELQVDRALWLGATDGIWDRQGVRIDRISRVEDFDSALASAKGSHGTDVTGGMQHRLQALWHMRDRVRRAWVLDGRRPDTFLQALCGVRQGGTEILGT